MRNVLFFFRKLDTEVQETEIYSPNEVENLQITDSPVSTEEDAPDGGYGWVVALCAFFIQIFSVGLIYSGGVFVVEFRESFNISPGEASWITAINTGIAYGCCKCKYSVFLEHINKCSEGVSRSLMIEYTIYISIPVLEQSQLG